MKGIKYFATAWVIALAIFNAITFVCVSNGSLTSGLIAGYICITAAFIGLLICGCVALSEKNITKKFYKIPLITESYAGLVMMLIFGSLTMIIQVVPQWPGIVICLAILAVTAFSVISASANADIVADIDAKVADETGFIKGLTKEAELLISQAKSEEVKVECVQVYEAFRYAPKRCKYSSDVEKEIREKFEELRNFVLDANIYEVQKSKELLIALING